MYHHFSDSQEPLKMGLVIIPILWMRKRRLGQVMWFVQDPPALGLKPVPFSEGIPIPSPLTFSPCTITEYSYYSSLRWPSLSEDLMWRHSQHRATAPRVQTSPTDGDQQGDFCSVALLIYAPRREPAILQGLVSTDAQGEGACLLAWNGCDLWSLKLYPINNEHTGH